mmetsp:Transcript_68660/g.200948  ORF Transcript_68660/g.200948 Transcript_68660/m.200948 type:complete len:705 (-) Transcript_68660:497-2611(-)
MTLEGRVLFTWDEPAFLGTVLGVACLCFLAYLLQLCRALGSFQGRAAALRAVGRLRAWARGAAGRPEERPEPQVRQLIARERAKWFLSFAGPFAHVFALALAVSLLFFTLQLLEAATVLDETSWASKASSLLDLTWQLMICLIFSAFPRCVTPRAMNLTYVSLSAWWIVETLILSHAGTFTIFFPAIYAQRAVWGLVVCNGWTTTVCNVVITVCQCAARWWHLSSTHREALLRQETSHLVMVDIICTAMIVYGLVFLEQGVWAAARYIVEVKTSSKTEVTVLRLLSALCDAVVTLGSDLHIVSKAPKLANLVQQGNSANALEGSSFLDLLAETDCVRFRQFLAREPVWMDTFNEPEPAQALNVHLVDRSGVGKQVQLFHSHFQDHNDQVGHLIGICEVDTGGFRVEGGDREGGAREAAGDNTQPNRAAHVNEPTGLDDSVSTCRGIADLDSDFFPSDSVSGIFSRTHPAAADLHRGVGGGSAQSRGQGSASAGTRLPSPDGRAHGPLQQPEVALAFDSLRFQIKQSQNKTPVLDVSFLERESLQQWVTEWASCRAMVQDLVNAALRPVTAASWPARGGLPSSLSFQVAFGGTCPLPPDVLSRGAAAAPGHAPAPEAGNSWRRTSGGNDGGPDAPPTRLTVRRLKLAARRAPHSSRSFSSERLRGARRHVHHVQPALIGSGRVQRLQQAAETVAEAPSGDARVRL